MEIKKIGNKTIFLKGKKETVLINPTKADLASSRYATRIIIFDNADEDFVGISADKVIIKGAGEYEIGGIEILGLNGKSSRTIYVINIDGLRLGVMGQLTEEVSDKIVEKVEGLDVFIASVSSDSVMGAKKILELVKKWGANYFIPMEYDQNGVLVEFLDEADREGLEAVASLKVDRDNLPDGMEVVILKKE